MTKLLTLLYIILSGIVLTACTKEKEEGIWINFINKTGSPITQAKADETSIGFIAKDAQTGYKMFEGVQVNSGILLLDFTGQINGSFVETLPVRCGVGTYSLEPGRYNIVIDAASYGTTTYCTLMLEQ